MIAAGTAAWEPFGVLVPMLPIGLAGIWAARHGTFPPRPPAPRRCARDRVGVLARCGWMGAVADEAHEQIHVAADPLDCFDLASDFAAYPDWAKDVREATVLARDDAGRACRVEYRAAALGRKIRYVLDYDFRGRARFVLVDARRGRHVARARRDVRVRR